MKRLHATLLTLFLGIAALTFGKAQGATYYVNRSGGDDSNPGSITAPWKTIARANGLLAAGDSLYLRAGVYSEPIAPVNNGSSGNYIIYSNYQNETVTINCPSGIQAAIGGRSHIIINGLNFMNASGSWVDMTGTTYSTIQNCSFNSADTWGGIFMANGSNYNKILNNTLNATCNAYTGNGGPKDLIWIENGSYNLFEGNRFQRAPHTAIDIIGRGSPDQNQMNIIRNNTFSNFWHTDLNIFDGTGRTLIEGNMVLNSGYQHESNYCGNEDDRTGGHHKHHAIDLDAVDCIVRNNVFVNNGNFMMQSKPETGKYAINNRVYNNTFYKNFFNFYINSVDDIYGNVIKNNIISGGKSKDVLVAIGKDAQSANYFLSNNIPGSSITYKSASGPVKAIQAAYPSEWQKNTAKNPVFINAAKQNFHLSSRSPLIDSGDFLTTTISAGSGRSIPVQDARYFMDGWGIIRGDLIQLQGQKTQAKVLKVDYTNNVITVDRSLRWSAGLGVSLPYNGSAPDMGAFEYSMPAQIPN